MRLLDLFCGAGGASVGYARAGFDVVGVDIHDHPDYPFPFVQADALEVLTFLGDPEPWEHYEDWLPAARLGSKPFDVIHASPPCQASSDLRHMWNAHDHADLIAPTRDLLTAWGGSWVIENVEGSALRDPLVLCGASFGLAADCHDGVRRPLRRHRLFESNVWLMGPGCACSGQQPIGVYGTGGGGQQTRGYRATRTEAREAMGIDWMTHEDLVQAIPPAYTEHIGAQLAAHLERVA